MKTSAAGRAAIAQREGNKLQAYQDSVKIWTIGVGHTAAAGDPAPKRGMKITAAESDAILARDLGDVENDVNALVKVPVTQNQFDALVSLVFNIGGGNFRKSSVLRKINARDYDGAADAFLAWNKAGKPRRVLAGLTTRRKAERAQFLSGKPASTRPASVATIPAIEPNPAPAPASVTDKEQIRRVQESLTKLGYNPGGADGIMGPLTKGSILSFRNDNGLPPGDGIDDALITALATAPPRKMVPERANADSVKIATVVPEVNKHWWNKYLAIGGGATTAIGGAVEQLAPATGYLQPVKDFIGDIPTSVWIVAIILVAGVVWWNSRQGQIAGDDAYRTGARR